jgi:3-methyladenine DNA glycosylase Tag
MENLENQVDKILKDSSDIISLRTKLNAIANARASNKLSNNTQDLERYKTILGYFIKNKDRIEKNRTYLVDVMYNLIKYLPTQEDMSLDIQMKDILSEIKDYNFKSGTETGKGAIF